MKKQNLIRGATALAAAGLISKIVGAVYRIPLTNLLSAEGMGMYQLVYSVYALLLGAASAGIPFAVSRLVAERNALNLYSRGILKNAFAVTVLTGTIAATVLSFSGGVISKLQGNGEIAYGYAIIAPSILLAGALAVLRGWYQGNFNVYPTAVTQLVEQIAKLSCGLGFAYFLMPKGVVYGAFGALLGVTASEAAALICMLLYSAFCKPALQGIRRVGGDSSVKEILKIAFPIALGGLILPLSQFIDSILIVNVLKWSGQTTAQATSNYGLFSGSVMSLVNMPIVLTLSLAVVLVPSISANRVNCDLDGIIMKSATSIKLSYVVGLPAAIIMFVFAETVLTILYPALTAENIGISVMLLRIACFSAVFSAQTQIYNSLLQALDRTYTPVKNMLLAVALKTAVSVALLFFVGINGSAVAVLVLGAAATFLNVTAFNRLLGKNLKLVKNVSTILASSVIMILFAAFFERVIADKLAALIVGGGLSAIVYVLLLMAFKVFDKGELDGVPLVGQLEKLSGKIRFWEN